MAPSLRSVVIITALVLAGCAASEQREDPRVAQLQDELDRERGTRDRLITEEKQRATTAEDGLVQAERELARLQQELAASRASTAALQLASDTAMATVRRQEEELVRLRGGAAPVASTTGSDDEAGDGSPLGAAMALLRAKDKEIKTLQEELAIARNPDLVRQPGTAQKGVRASNLDLEVPVAIVDGERVTRRDFIEFLYRDLASPALLQLLVNRLLVLREARRRGLEVSDVDVAVWVQEQLVEQTGQAGGQEKFVERLAKGGFTRDAWEARLRFQARPVLLVRRMIEQDRQGAAGRDAFERRVRERYAKVHSDKVSARHILVAVGEEAPPEEVAVARRKIEALSDLVKKQPFSEVARRSSDDRQSKGQGGQLGRFDRSRFAELPELNTAFFTLAPGTVSAPIRTPAGFHLVLVDERFPPDKPYDEETRAKMAKEVSAEPPSEDEQQGLLDRLQKEAHVTQSLTFD